MFMIRRMITACVVVALLCLVGCGDSERGKFRDQKDRPKSADKVEK